MKLLSRVQLFVTPWIVAYQASPSVGFSRQEYWSGLPFPSPGDRTQVSCIGGRRFNLWATREAHFFLFFFFWEAHFYTISVGKPKVELENNSLLYIFQKNKLRIHLTKVQNLYSENYQTTMKEIKELDKFASISCSQTGRLFTEGSSVQWVKRRQHSPNWYTDSTQPLSKSRWLFLHNLTSWF